MGVGVGGLATLAHDAPRFAYRSLPALAPLAPYSSLLVEQLCVCIEEACGRRHASAT